MNLEPINVAISLRPVRIGFLVDPTKRAVLSKVMRLASCMWGGMMCLIIPVIGRVPKQWRTEWDRTKGPEITKGYIRFFEPDIFVETAADQHKLAELNAEGLGSRQRIRSLASLIRKDHGLAADLDVGVNMYHIYSHLYREEFQFQKRVKPRIFDFKGGDAVSVAFFEAAFGCFPKGKVLSYLPKVYRDAFDAEVVTPSAKQWREMMEKGAGYPLYYTVRDIEAQFESSRDPTIFIFDPLNPLDVIDFWNFRIFNRHVLPVNSHWLDESRDAVVRCIRENYQPLPTNPNGIMIRTGIHVARSMDFEKIAEQLRLNEVGLPQDSLSIQGWYEPIWGKEGRNRFNASPGILSVKSRDAQVVPSEDERPTIRFPLQAPDFKDDFRGVGPSWVNVVQVRQYGSIKNFADVMPTAAAGDRPGYPIYATHEQFVSREGYVTFHNYKSDEGYLQLPRREQAVINWLKSEGINAAPSEAGRIADQVISAVGGLSGISLLREREVLDLLNKMSISRREWGDGASDEFQDRTAKASVWDITLKKVQQRVWGKWKTLQRYVDAGVIRLGLSVSCTHCGKENWYSLEGVAATIECSRCLKSYKYPQGDPLKKDVWKYRVIGPFASPNYAEGSYCVALTLGLLQKGFGAMAQFTFTTGLELRIGEHSLETDFFAWHNDGGFRRSTADPITLVGECKSYGTDVFKPKDIARLKELALALQGAHLVVATLKDELGADEIGRLRGLAKWCWRQKVQTPLILLTGIELFDARPFGSRWEKAEGPRGEAFKAHGHIFEFDTLASATQQAILGFTAEEIRDMRYGGMRQKRTKARKGPVPVAAETKVG